jgi:hypothetical protein
MSEGQSLAEEWGIVDKAPAIHELPGQRIRDRVIAFSEEAKYLAAASPTLHDLAVLRLIQDFGRTRSYSLWNGKTFIWRSQ